MPTRSTPPASSACSSEHGTIDPTGFADPARTLPPSRAHHRRVSRMSRTRSTAWSSTTPERAASRCTNSLSRCSSASILVALAFDFLNGLHDAANSHPRTRGRRRGRCGRFRPVAFAAFFNFAAYFLTVMLSRAAQGGRDDRQGPDRQGSGDPGGGVRRAGRATMFWNVVTWLKGIPRRRATRWSAGSSAPAWRMPGSTGGSSGPGSTRPLIAIVLSPSARHDARRCW